MLNRNAFGLRFDVYDGDAITPLDNDYELIGLMLNRPSCRVKDHSTGKMLSLNEAWMRYHYLRKEAGAYG